jgi:ubiquitin-like domain-containing CTD phosphatase 1
MQSIQCSWKGKKHILQVNGDSTIADLKEMLCEITLVLPEKQKLLGLVKGKLPPDDTVVSHLDLKEMHNFMMMGTAEKDMIIEPVGVNSEVVDVTYFHTGL